MDTNQKQSIIRELIKEAKGDYKVPGKLFVWGVVVGQWMVITIIGSIFLAILVYFITLGFRSSRDVDPNPTNVMHIQSIEEQGKAEAEKDLVAHLKEVAEFMKASASSVNKRQEIVENLTAAISSYVDRTLDQAQLEKKEKNFSSILSTCNEYRGIYMKDFANNINPFDDPHISRAFDKLVVGHFFVSPHVLNPQAENKRWEDLCAFCRQEANKAKDELVQMLKSGGGTQTEGAAAQTSFFK
ncbi:MAG: hypothetical protein KBD90_00010 [Alphaproteobacteria bacterium]|nr:hypothetical protein [Alphaproteobacteria bacterium]